VVLLVSVTGTRQQGPRSGRAVIDASGRLRPTRGSLFRGRVAAWLRSTDSPCNTAERASPSSSSATHNREPQSVHFVRNQAEESEPFPYTGAITVLHGKGDRKRVVGLDQGSMAIVMRWVDKRGSLGINGRSRLFCTLDGKPLHASYVRTLLHRLGAKAGIEKRVHPHALRHSMAFDLMWERVPVPLIQAQLGHASLATTQRYLDHLAPKDLVDTMQRREFKV
jgi:hypothetical protein